MAAVCDVSFDEMALALSYISLSGGSVASPAAASTARALPLAAPVKKAEKPKPKPADDDEVGVRRYRQYCYEARLSAIHSSSTARSAAAIKYCCFACDVVCFCFADQFGELATNVEYDSTCSAMGQDCPA